MPLTQRDVLPWARPTNFCIAERVNPSALGCDVDLGVEGVQHDSRSGGWHPCQYKSSCYRLRS
eukprot:1838644-Amphidinium_carterae.1